MSNFSPFRLRCTHLIMYTSTTYLMDAGPLEKIIEDKWRVFVSTDGDEIPASNISVTIKALAEHRKSPHPVRLCQHTLKKLKSFVGTMDCACATARLPITVHPLGEPSDPGRTGTDRKKSLSKSFLKKEHADVRHMCMAAAHAATFPTADYIQSDLAITEDQNSVFFARYSKVPV